jgi:hypothetical protein
MTIVPKVAASPTSKELSIAMWFGIISPAASRNDDLVRQFDPVYEMSSTCRLVYRFRS